MKTADFPQLKLIAWSVDPTVEIDEREAFALYEAGWRHVDITRLQDGERAFIQRLTDQYGCGILNV